MCHQSCIDFVRNAVGRGEIQGNSVIEVGALDVNGSVRNYIQGLQPCKYVGVDIIAGPGVDEVCNACDLQTRFGPQSFDVVISTELMEHVIDWRRVISNFKGILRSEGIIVLTTRSRGFHYHGYPYDLWRYEPDDLGSIFSDFNVVELQQDTQALGVFIKAVKPDEFHETNLSDYELYCVVKLRRAKRVTALEARVLSPVFSCLQKCIPPGLKTVAKRAVRW